MYLRGNSQKHKKKFRNVNFRNIKRPRNDGNKLIYKILLSTLLSRTRFFLPGISIETLIMPKRKKVEIIQVKEELHGDEKIEVKNEIKENGNASGEEISKVNAKSETKNSKENNFFVLNFSCFTLEFLWCLFRILPPEFL